MFFLPFSTDAPIYYRPIGTVGLILVNVIAFGITIGAPHLMAAGALPYGEGLTPLRWLTSAFLHAGFWHLAGNMLFLWGFGIIVEGKLGWQKFTAVYLGICVIEGAIEQFLFAQHTGMSLGASSAIAGLLAIALIWAPMNELSVFFLFFIRAYVFEVSILVFSGLYLLYQVGMAFLMAKLGVPVSSELLHLLGAGVGAAIGSYLVVTDRVDCEGWDLFSVMKGQHPTSESALSESYKADLRRREKQRAKRTREISTGNTPPDFDQPKPTVSTARFTQLIRARKPTAAFSELESIRHWMPDWKPTTGELLSLARGLKSRQEWDKSVYCYQQVLEDRPHFSLGRLELAEILVTQQRRPSAARRMLRECDLNDLSPVQVERVETLKEKIQQLIDDGIIELEGRSW